MKKKNETWPGTCLHSSCMLFLMLAIGFHSYHFFFSNSKAGLQYISLNFLIDHGRIFIKKNSVSI